MRLILSWADIVLHLLDSQAGLALHDLSRKKTLLAQAPEVGLVFSRMSMNLMTKIPDDLLDNRNQFQSPFFSQFTLRTAPHPLKLSEKIEKNYLFPTLYGDVQCAMAMFFADYQAAVRLISDPDLVPVKMPLNRSLVIFSCYEYRNVLGVRPYHEIAMTIPVLGRSKFHPPLLPVMLPHYPKMGYFVFSMPVTSLENQIRGARIWGLPKVVQPVTIQIQQGYCKVQALNSSGQLYLELKIPTIGKPKRISAKSHLYSRLEGKLLKSPTWFEGTFQLNQYLQTLVKKDLPWEQPSLVLGNVPEAEILRQLNLSQHPFQFRYTPSMNSAFDLSLNNFS